MTDDTNNFAAGLGEWSDAKNNTEILHLIESITFALKAAVKDEDRLLHLRQSYQTSSMQGNIHVNIAPSTHFSSHRTSLGIDESD